MRTRLLLSAPLVLGAAALGAPSSLPPAEKAPAVPQPPQSAFGRLVPEDLEILRLDPEAWQGPFELVDVAGHGAPVREGEVVARFEREGWEEAMEEAERAVEEARWELEKARLRASLDERRAALRREEAARNLVRAREKLERFERFEREFDRRSAELSRARSLDSLEDAQDELAQLEAMYSEDELVDATEEIVLKRSRRNLERSQASFGLQEDRRKYHERFELPEKQEDLERAVERAGRELENLEQQLHLEAEDRERGLHEAERRLEEAEKELQRLREDEAWFELRAPRDGVLVHGSAEAPARWKEGDRVQPGQDFLSVGEAGRYRVELLVSEWIRFGGLEGKAVEILGAGGSRVLGTVHFARFPEPATGEAEDRYRAVVEIAEPPPWAAPGMRVTVLFPHEKE